MPEGPEVRREADAIAAALVGQQLVKVEFGLPRLGRYSSLLEGASVTAVESRGKAMLLYFDVHYAMYSHNQLYGKWLVAARDDLKPTNRSLRVGLHTLSHSVVLYSASDIEIMPVELVEEHPFIRRLGPDVLSAALSWREIAKRLGDRRFSRRTLATIYLDQSFLAGIGNYMRSEILHEAALCPRLRPSDLSRAEIGRLSRATLLISQRAYQGAGVTNAPSRVRTLQKRGFKRRDYRFSVFDREGMACYRCLAEVLRLELAGRRLYFCGGCQRAASGD
jgi:endonuclease-8